MPTYEYLCRSKECAHSWEEIQSISDPPQQNCPVCNQASAQRLISAGTGFILVGGGWAADRYQSK